jgi:hypothetical protein
MEKVTVHDWLKKVNDDILQNVTDCENRYPGAKSSGHKDIKIITFSCAIM